MTINQALDLIQNKMNNTDKNNDPRLEAEFLLSHILKKPRAFLIAHPEIVLNNKDADRLEEAIKKLIDGYPLAYIIGEKEFYGLSFNVNENVLIPRPETEVMIDEIIKLTVSNNSYLLLDVGTGSGAVAVSLAKKLGAKDNLSFIATDISPKAINTAKLNAKKHNVDKIIEFKIGDLLQPARTEIDSLSSDDTLLISANLPYLSPNDIDASPSIKYEPRLALEAGDDGLDIYRRLLKQLAVIKTKVIAFFEIDPAQTGKIKQLVKNELPDSKTDIIQDLANNNRFCKIEIR